MRRILGNGDLVHTRGSNCCFASGQTFRTTCNLIWQWFCCVSLSAVVLDDHHSSLLVPQSSADSTIIGYTGSEPITVGQPSLSLIQPGIERVQSTRWHFAFALCCHSKATRAPIANPPNSAQLGGTLYHSPKLHPGPRAVVWASRREQTHRHTDARDHYTFCIVYDSLEK